MDMLNRQVLIVVIFSVSFIAFGLLIALGCNQNTLRVSSALDAKSSLPENVDEWIVYLHDSYNRGGIKSFDKARLKMMRHIYALKTDEDYSEASMVLGLDWKDPIVKKEFDLAFKLRELATTIESNPGESSSEWECLKNKLYSYMFGNGEIDKNSIVVRIVLVYADIAGVAESDR